MAGLSPLKAGAFTEIREARIEIARGASTNYNGMIESEDLSRLSLCRQNTTKSGLISRFSFLDSIHAFYGSTGKATYY